MSRQGVATFNGGAAFHHAPPSVQGSSRSAGAQQLDAHPHRHLDHHAPSAWGTFGTPGSASGGGGPGRGGLGALLGLRKAPPQPPHHTLPPWISPQLESGALQGAGSPGSDSPSSGSPPSAGMPSEAGGGGGGGKGFVAAGIEALKGRLGRGLLGSRGWGGRGQQPQAPLPPPRQGVGGEGGGSAMEGASGAAQEEVLTAQHLGLQRISTQRTLSAGLTTAGSAPPLPNQVRAGSSTRVLVYKSGCVLCLYNLWVCVRVHVCLRACRYVCLCMCRRNRKCTWMSGLSLVSWCAPPCHAGLLGYGRKLLDARPHFTGAFCSPARALPAFSGAGMLAPTVWW